MKVIRLSIPASIIYLTVISTTFGYREYIAVVDEFRCFTYNDFFKNVSCKLYKPSTMSAYIEMQKEVNDVRLDAILNVTMNNNMEAKQLYNYKGIKACDILNEPVLNPVLRIMKQMMREYLTLPKRCPVPSNFVFLLSNCTWNSEILPVVLPEGTFKSYCKLYSGKILGLVIELRGRVVHNKVKTKGRRTTSKQKQAFWNFEKVNEKV